MTLIEAINNTTAQFEAAGIANARLDAEVLLAFVAKKNRAWIITHIHEVLDTKLREAFESVVRRRVTREPLQYILGTQEFWGRDFVVTPDVLIPRPETELAVETALKAAGSRGQKVVIVDLCTGSGCIAITLAKELPGAQVLAVDKSAAALSIAEKNSLLHCVADRIRFVEGDLLQPLEKLDIRAGVDIIVSNPPYVQAGDYRTLQPEVRDYEPEMALVAGPHGIEFHQRIIQDAPRYLKRHGTLIMEMGLGQSEMLMEMIRQSHAFTAPAVLKDLAGIERVIVARRN